MPAESILVVPFTSVYVGNADAPSTKLSFVFCNRTNGAKVYERMPSTYCADVDSWDQDDDYQVGCGLTFLFGDKMTTRIRRGLSVTETSLNKPPGQQLYSVLLVHPNFTAGESYFFPRVRSVRNWEAGYSKKEATQYAIDFEGRNRDSTIVKIVKGTLTDTDMTTALGSQNPFV